MAALEARSLLTRETILSPDALYPAGVGGIIGMVGGLRLKQWARSRQNAGRHQIGIGGRLTSESARQVSGSSNLAKAMRYAIRHWPGLVVFLDDGRVEMDANVVERAIRPKTLTRKNALFAGSDGGAKHWAPAMALIQTARLNGVEPLAWLTDVLERIVSGRTKAHEMHSLLPWTWARANASDEAEQLAA
jgi:transposase